VTVTVQLQTIGTCVPPPSGLVGWWPGDGDAKDIENGSNGTLVGGAGFAPGWIGQAFALDASADSGIRIHSTDALNPPLITIDAWVRPFSFPTTGSAVVRKDVVQGQTQYSLMAGDGLTPGVPHCNLGIPGSALSGSQPVPLNKWTHLACSY